MHLFICYDKLTLTLTRIPSTSLVVFAKGFQAGLVPEKLTICESIKFCLRYVSPFSPSSRLERTTAVRLAPLLDYEKIII
jgi:hypothetical protein